MENFNKTDRLSLSGVDVPSLFILQISEHLFITELPTECEAMHTHNVQHHNVLEETAFISSYGLENSSIWHEFCCGYLLLHLNL